MTRIRQGEIFSMAIKGKNGRDLPAANFTALLDMDLIELKERYAQFVYYTPEYDRILLVNKALGRKIVHEVDLTSAGFIAWLVDREDIAALKTKSVEFSAKSDGDAVSMTITVDGVAHSSMFSPADDDVDILWAFSNSDRLHGTRINMASMKSENPFENSLSELVAAEVLRKLAMQRELHLDDTPLPYGTGNTPNGDRVTASKSREYSIVIKEPVKFAGTYQVTVSYSEIRRAPRLSDHEGKTSIGYGARAHRIDTVYADQRISNLQAIARAVSPEDLHYVLKAPSNDTFIPRQIQDALAARTDAFLVGLPEGDLGALVVMDVDELPDHFQRKWLLEDQRPVFGISHWNQRDVKMAGVFVGVDEINRLNAVSEELERLVGEGGLLLGKPRL